MKRLHSLIRSIIISIIAIVCVVFIAPHYEPLKDKYDDFTSSLKGSQSINIEQTEEDEQLLSLKFNPQKYPDYYVSLKSDSVLTDEDQSLIQQKGGLKSWSHYLPLDQLGRAQEVKAVVDYKMVNTHSSKYLKNRGLLYGDKKIYQRPAFASYVHLAGEYQPDDARYDESKQSWKGTKSNNERVKFHDGSRQYLYNKSHLLAWSLGGDMETHNLVLGTRAQNVGEGNGGMRYLESKVKDSIENNHSLKVFYAAKPIYQDKELVPRGVRVKAYSLNDKGRTINESVYVFNNQQGIDVDYNTGEFVNHN